MYYKRGNNERKKQRSSRDAGKKKSGHLMCARNANQRRGLYGFWGRRGSIQVFMDGREGQERWGVGILIREELEKEIVEVKRINH